MKKSKFTEEQIAFAKRVAGLKGIGTIIWHNVKGEHNRFCSPSNATIISALRC